MELFDNEMSISGPHGLDLLIWRSDAGSIVWICHYSQVSNIWLNIDFTLFQV